MASSGRNGRSPHAWWPELRHGGMLLSPVVLAEWLPDGPPPLDERRYRRLRDRFTAFQAKTAGGHDGPALHDWRDALLEDFLGHPKERWRKGADVPVKVTATSVTGQRLRPHRVLLEGGGSQRLGGGRADRGREPPPTGRGGRFAPGGGPRGRWCEASGARIRHGLQATSLT
jgi:hypothetical protein